MSYEKQNFADGQVLKAQQLNHIEDGISVLENEINGTYYIPLVDSSGNLSWTGTKENMPTILETNIKGPKGDKGDKGAAGYTPARGIDYWTPADIAEIKSYVDDAILGGEW